MNAIILAAGMGKRLKELTYNNAKCMIQVSGTTLIERLLRQIDKQDVHKITIVIGYKGQALRDYISSLSIQTPIEYIENQIYDKTNNIYSLSLAKDVLCEDDTLLFESDIIFEDSIIKALIEDTRPTLALVDKYEAWMNGTCVKTDKNDNIVAFVPGKEILFSEADSYYKTVNIYKFSKQFSQEYYVPALEAYEAANGENEYYEQVLRVLTETGNTEMKAKRLRGHLWYEIDDIQDLDIASSLFERDAIKRYTLLEQRNGGYWRYPKLLDFNGAGKSYFPSARMIDEMKFSFNKLMTQTPSGSDTIRLLFSKCFNVRQEYIAACSCENAFFLSLSASLKGRNGFIADELEICNAPCFEGQIRFSPSEEGAYNVDSIIQFFKQNRVDNIILSNPQRHLGGFINRENVLTLLKWCDCNGIVLVIDESFIDFADEGGHSLLHNDILEAYNNLIIYKNISVSCGISGAGMSVVFSKELSSHLKRDVVGFHVHSFSEFFLQIFEKYKEDYQKALMMFKAERARMSDELSKIQGICVFPSQSDIIVIDVKKTNSRQFAAKLLNDYNIFVGITETGSFIRIAVRTAEDNDKLLTAIKETLSQ
ncbi:MAG: aminotransferase class I/II-fold pyridoxal phosphate-dependent enzyme [Eubacterium sp.]|nr:aminotransferase class I/II-fold pyridoxal phosphate-dependent enzyme [Eubacterium sp.]